MQLIVFVGLIGLIWANPASKTASTGPAHEALKNMRNVLSAYDRAFKQCAPLTKFHLKLQDYTRSHMGYSPPSGELVGQLTTMLLNIDSEYFQATRSLNGLCAESTPLLEGYVQMFEGYSPEMADAQKELLQAALQASQDKSSKALRGLEQTVSKFNAASHKLDDLIVQLTSDFKDNSDFFKSEVKAAQAEAALKAAVNQAPKSQGQWDNQQAAPGNQQGQDQRKVQKPAAPMGQPAPNAQTATSGKRGENEANTAEIIAQLKKRFTETKQFYADLKNQMNEEIGKIDFVSIDNNLKSKNVALASSNAQVGSAGVFAQPNEISSIKNAINKFTNKCSAI